MFWLRFQLCLSRCKYKEGSGPCCKFISYPFHIQLLSPPVFISPPKLKHVLHSFSFHRPSRPLSSSLPRLCCRIPPRRCFTLGFMRSCRPRMLCFLASRTYFFDQRCRRQINELKSNRPWVAPLMPSWASWMLMLLPSLVSSVVSSSYLSCIWVQTRSHLFLTSLVNCNPITAIGTSSTSCDSQPLCCSDNSFVSSLVLHIVAHCWHASILIERSRGLWMRPH